MQITYHTPISSELSGTINNHTTVGLDVQFMRLLSYRTPWSTQKQAAVNKFKRKQMNNLSALDIPSVLMLKQNSVIWFLRKHIPGVACAIFRYRGNPSPRITSYELS